MDRPFEKLLALSKQDLGGGGHEVLSIEGAALEATDNDGIELFVSSEKDGIGYPAPLAEFLKPGTGVWTIDHLRAPSADALDRAPIHTVLQSHDPETLHVKDPFLYRDADGLRRLFFCSHPYCWTSSNSGYAPVRSGQVEAEGAVYDFFPRGSTWDVAITRATCALDVPRVGRFGDRRVTLLFYDGGESIRPLEEHSAAVRRPRGYSCEELGGAAYVVDGDFSRVHRLSRVQPLFVSPWGTGCSRYVDALNLGSGIVATWQQSQADGSQPLVLNFVDRGELESLLG